MNTNLKVGSFLLFMCLALSFGIVYAESAATGDVNATLSNNTTNESVSIPENTTNVTLSNAANPFAKTKGAIAGGAHNVELWKDSTAGTGGGIKN
jgi:hypothetical protein